MDDQQVQSESSTAAPAVAVQRWLLSTMVVLVAMVVALAVQVNRLHNDVRDLSDQVAFQPDAGPDMAPRLDDICRLLGALASTQNVRTGDVFDQLVLSDCETAATAGAKTVR